MVPAASATAAAEATAILSDAAMLKRLCCAQPKARVVSGASAALFAGCAVVRRVFF